MPSPKGSPSSATRAAIPRSGRASAEAWTRRSALSRHRTSSDRRSSGWRRRCHHDAVAANVFARERDGSAETVLIDWESVGPGPAGADLASLLFSSPRRGDFSARRLPELIPAALSAYERGIADTRASVRSDEVRLGLHASVSLRWTLVRDVIGLLGDPGRARRGSAPHETPDAALAELLALVPVLLDSAAKARRLISAG